MSTSKNPKNSNGPTHMKRLARAFAATSGRPYAQCLEIVRRAHAAGRLPTPLDDEGIQKGVELLMQIEPPALDLPAFTESTDEQRPARDPWAHRPAFGTLLDGSRAELGDHLVAVGATGSGKTVALNHLAYDALRLGWSVEYIDLIKGGDIPRGAVHLASGTLHVSTTIEQVQQRLDAYLDELIETGGLITKHDVERASQLPEDVRGVPTLLIIDEWLPIQAHDRLAARVARFVATGHSLGIHVVIGTQDAWSPGWELVMKDNMDRFMLGRAPLGAVAVTFRNPDAAAALYNAAIEEHGNGRGIGLYERGGIPQVVRVPHPVSFPTKRDFHELPALTRALITGADQTARRILSDIPSGAEQYVEEIAQIVRLEAEVLGEEIEHGLLALTSDQAAHRMLLLRSQRKAVTWLESGFPESFGVRAAIKKRVQSDRMHPVDTALMLAPTALDRRKAGRAADQRIWDASWAFEKLTGFQGLLTIEAVGKGADRYRFGDDGANGSFTALGANEAERHIMARLDALRTRTDLPGPLEWDAERCMACRKPVIPGHAIFDGTVTTAEDTLDGLPAGTQRIALCSGHVDKYHSPASVQGSDAAGRDEALFGRVDSAVLHEYLVACERASVKTMLGIGRTLAAAPLVVTWWYPDNGSPETRRLVRRTRPQLRGEESNLVLIDRDGETSEEGFGWEDEPEKVTRHRIHSDGLGVSFYSPQGTPSRTHRVLQVAPGASLRDLLTGTPGHPTPEVSVETGPFELPKPGALQWARFGKRKSDREMVKVSEIYRDADGNPTRISAEVVYPIPPRTTVRFWTIEEARTEWSDITDADYRAYERAWDERR